MTASHSPGADRATTNGGASGAMLGAAWEAYAAAARRERDRARDRDVTLYPHYTENGQWHLLPAGTVSTWGEHSTFEKVAYEHGNWTAGFWFGVMWLLGLDGDDDAAALAASRMDVLAPRSVDGTTHDLGFLFVPSFVLPYETGRLELGDTAPALAAARTLGRRFNPFGDYIQAFGPIGDHRFAGTSTIDTMLNLPLLWWAGNAHGDKQLLEIARRHARVSARLFFRADGSTFHLNHYDPLAGTLLNRGTFQGASGATCWSRGQAWATTGFAWAYAATGELELLEAADRAATYFWDHLPADGIPSWDFSDESPDAPRDASAAAVAALGALFLGHTHPDEATADAYWERGTGLLEKLVACINHGEESGILLHACYSKPHRLGVDGSTGFGDYFMGLALALATGRLDLRAALGFEPVGGPAVRRVRVA
jgi:unsaturated chondroitin disaccharide hydrolase